MVRLFKEHITEMQDLRTYHTKGTHYGAADLVFSVGTVVRSWV